MAAVIAAVLTGMHDLATAAGLLLLLAAAAVITIAVIRRRRAARHTPTDTPTGGHDPAPRARPVPLPGPPAASGDAKTSSPATPPVPPARTMAPIPDRPLPTRALDQTDAHPGDDQDEQTDDHRPGAIVTGSRRAWLLSEYDGGEHLLTDEAARVGRAFDNDVLLLDTSVSRRHAVLRYEQGGWVLYPEPTSNGTFVNDSLVQAGERLRLRDGDRLRFGNAALALRMPAAQVTLNFTSTARTTPGRRRDNQDVHLATDGILAVADGVHGRNAGRTAARTAIGVAARSSLDYDVAQVVDAANEAVRRAAASDAGLTGMATTLDIVRLRSEDDGRWLLEGAHVGDGVVLVQDADGVRVVTRADTVGQRLEARHPERAAELRDDPDYHQLAAAIGLSDAVQPQTWSRPAVVGVRVLAASDGLVDAIGLSSIMNTLLRSWTSEITSVAEELLRLAIDGRDNATVVVAEVRSSSADYASISPREVPAIEAASSDGRDGGR